MTTYKVVGKQRKTGEYNGTSYDNSYLYCIDINDRAPESLVGSKVSTIKASSRYLDLDRIEVGETYNIYFNQYGQFDSIFPID